MNQGMFFFDVHDRRPKEPRSSKPSVLTTEAFLTGGLLEHTSEIDLNLRRLETLRARKKTEET